MLGDRFSGRHWHALLLAAAVLLLLTRLGSLDLWAPDEPRYAQVAEEVRALDRGPQGLLLLTLNGDVYDQKPPLYYWLAALAGMPGGRVTEGAARLPSALAGVALVALTFALGARRLGRSSAFFGAGILLTAALFAYASRRAQLDVVLALFETLALIGFLRLDRDVGSRRSNLILMHAAMGLAVLTKGPVGVLLPTLVIAGYLTWEGRLRSFLAAFPLRALALSVLPGALWIALATMLAPDGFFHDAVVDNVFGRFFIGTSKVNPWYYFIGVFPLNFLPWSVLWPLVFLVGRRQIFAPGADEETRRTWRFLLAWVGATFIFFSFSTGKRDLYLVPCYPAVALLCGDAVVRGLRGLPALPRWVVRPIAALAVALTAACLLVAVAPVIPMVDVPFAFAAAMAAVMFVAFASWRSAERRAGALGSLALTIGTILAIEFSIFMLFFPALEAQKSPRLIAHAAAELSPPGQPIGLVEEHPFVGALAYYSGHRVIEVGPAENLRRYFDDGGRVAVMSARALERVRAGTFSEIRARFRSGKRELLVVTPRVPAANGEDGAGSSTADSGAHIPSS